MFCEKTWREQPIHQIDTCDVKENIYVHIEKNLRKTTIPVAINGIGKIIHSSSGRRNALVIIVLKVKLSPSTFGHYVIEGSTT